MTRKFSLTLLYLYRVFNFNYGLTLFCGITMEVARVNARCLSNIFTVSTHLKTESLGVGASAYVKDRLYPGDPSCPSELNPDYGPRYVAA